MNESQNELQIQERISNCTHKIGNDFAWVQDNEHKQQYRCSLCNALAYRFARHTEWKLFHCAHTKIFKNGDVSCRRNACKRHATMWHIDSPYCTEHKPVDRHMAREKERIAKSRSVDLANALRFAQSMMPLVHDILDDTVKYEKICRLLQDKKMPIPNREDIERVINTYTHDSRPSFRLSEKTDNDMNVAPAILFL